MLRKRMKKKRNQTRQSTTIEMETRQMMLGDEKKEHVHARSNLYRFSILKSNWLCCCTLLSTIMYVRSCMHLHTHWFFPIFFFMFSLDFIISFHFISFSVWSANCPESVSIYVKLCVISFCVCFSCSFTTDYNDFELDKN